MTREEVLLSGFVAIESAHFYSAFLPSIMTIKKFSENQFDRQSLRQGEAIATAFALLLGWVISELIDHRGPFVASVLTSILMIVVYEWAIQQKFGSAVNSAVKAVLWPEVR